jgi:hypothetical protein
MSAPDSPSSKARPSLLSETAKSAADNDSRILANLEGRVAAQPNSTRRSNKLWLVVVAAALGLSAFGAWQWQRASRDDGQTSPRVASALDGVQKTAAAPAASAAAARVIADASGTAADTLQTAASAPQPAVILADTAANDRPASAPAGALASAASAAPAATAAIGASASDSERLSRALSDGASASGSAAAPAAHAKSAVAAREATNTTKTAKTTSASHTVREADKKHQAQRVASAHPRKDANAGAKKTDQDVDLLAAIVARTKPYDANHGKTSAKTAAAQKTQTATSGAPGLAGRVAECSTRGLIEGQFCRWHVCADHWGKDPACPSSTFQSAGSSN